MLLTEVLKDAGFQYDYQVINEKPFDTLALCGAQLSMKICTFLDDVKYSNSLQESVTMVITTPKMSEFLKEKDYGLVLTEYPRQFFFCLHNYLAKKNEYAKKTEETVVAEGAKISELAYIASNNVRIAANVVIEPFVTIYSNVSIGENSIIRSGTRIGGEGFEFKRDAEGIMPVKHLGSVEIGCNVEIQNNACIDKALYPWDKTVIADDVKIDDLVYIAHGVKVGKNTMLAANSTIGGRTEIGTNVWIGLGATIRNGITVGDGARVNMGAVVTRSVDECQVVSGNFAIEHSRLIENVKKMI